MKNKFLPLLLVVYPLLLVVFLTFSLSAQVQASRTVAQLPDQVDQIAFVDFNEGFFLVPRLVDTPVPFTSNPWSVIENRSSILSFENDRIYVLAPSRIVISGNMNCSKGDPTYFQISTMGATAVFRPIAGSLSGSFVLLVPITFTEADFANGSPEIAVTIRHNATLTLGCFVHLMIEAK